MSIGEEDRGGFGLLPKNTRQYLSSSPQFDANSVFLFKKLCFPSPPIRFKEEDFFCVCVFHVFR